MAAAVSTLLRYPGGKQRALKILAQFIPPELPQICSPFLGGGSFELYCATALNIPVVAYDNLKPLVEFWQVLLTAPGELAAAATQYAQALDRVKFKSLQMTQQTLPSPVARAAAFYVLNRASFSGCTLRSGLSRGHPRLNSAALHRITAFPGAQVAQTFSVAAADFQETLARHPDTFLYLDPPYALKNENLYGTRQRTGPFAHATLHQLLRVRGGEWLLCYNNSPYIKSLYSEFVQLPCAWKYGMGVDKNSREVLILSPALAARLGHSR